MTTTTYRLASDPMIYAPGFVAFAINGARFGDIAPMARLIAGGWDIPLHAARQLVTGTVPYTIEDEIVVFTAKDPRKRAERKDALDL